MHFMFKIGPLPGVGDPSSAFFVYPGQEGVETFFASSDKDALAQITSIYPSAELECEPQLAAEAGKFGIAAGQMTPDRAAVLALLTFGIALPDHFREIKSRDLVYQYGMACSAFWRSAPWRFDCATGSLQVAFSGSVAMVAEATVLGSGGKQFGLGVFPQAGSLQSISRLIQDRNVDDVASLDMLGVTYEGEPGFAIDGMSRAFDLERFPIPMKVVHGERVRLTEEDLLLLAVALHAISRMPDQGEKGASQICVDGRSIEAVVTPQVSA